jgi:hypothetical protein
MRLPHSLASHQRRVRLRLPSYMTQAQSGLAQTFYDAELATLGERAALPSGGTVIVVARPRPASRVVFDLEEGSLDALLPPTYFHYRSTFEDVRRDLEARALPGVPIDQLGEPLKAVASRLGLVRYGRNNVAYVPGAGSYVQLCGYVTEADPEA